MDYTEVSTKTPAAAMPSAPPERPVTMHPDDPNAESALLELEAIIDQLAYEDFEPTTPLARVREHVGPEAPSTELIQQYFATGDYPYAQRMTMATYYREKHALQVELVKLQNWVKDEKKTHHRCFRRARRRR